MWRSLIMGVLSDRYRRPAALSGGKATSKVYERCGSGGWPGPHLFLKTIFPLDLRGSTRITKSLTQRENFVLRTCFPLPSTENEDCPQHLHNHSPHFRLVMAQCSFSRAAALTDEISKADPIFLFRFSFAYPIIDERLRAKV